MKHKYITFLALPRLFLLFISVSAFSQSASSILVEETKPQLISNQFRFTEGPAVDRQGNVYFTDQPNNTIWKYGTDGKLSVFLKPAGRSNGTYVDRKGNLITCADDQNQLWSIDPQGKVTVLVENFQGHRLNGPNDLWIDPQGGIYFTDPYFQRDYWERKSPDPEIKGENLYYLAPGKKEAVVADSDLGKPNGLVGTPDGKFLYVADMSKKTIFKYQMGADGRLTNRQPFIKDLADGMTLDNQGNLYLAGRGVSVYSAEGKKIQQIDVPSNWTANVCFAGKKKDILFITASESVYILPMKVKGVE